MIDTNYYKNELETKLIRITDELKSIGTHNPQTDDWTETPSEGSGEADINVEADLSEELEERRSTLAQLEIEYRNIKRALDKIAQGTYGLCEISGLEIEEARLKFNPAARTCMAHMNEEAELTL